MIDYYETSPRKIEPEYFNTEEKKINKKGKVNKTVNNIQNNSKQNKTMEVKKNISHIFYIIVSFSILLTIAYRYAIINARFNEKENLKAKLAEIQKLNQQLTVSIEQGMNINKIEQEAKEKLGMQKLDNDQKVYINLEKSDFIESSSKNSEEDTAETWWSKLLKDIFNMK